jgi:NADH dehydrogenase [ubiquinone] 1 alpha subcomplex assembly factor 2
MAREGRPIFRIIFQNFINSFRPRQMKGNYIGEDYLGNKYYEIPADAKTGKRKTSRWFEPPASSTKSSFTESNDPDDHGHELTAEWESWLRGRR